MSFDYSQFKKLRDNFARKADEYDAFLYSLLLEQGLRALTLTKENTPVDTGLLRNMWQLGDSHNVVRFSQNGKKRQYTEDSERSETTTIKSVRHSGTDLIIEIYNNVEYASFIEDGHKLRGGKGKYEGVHMARLAIAQIEKEMPTRFEARFKDWLKGLEEI